MMNKENKSFLLSKDETKLFHRNTKSKHVFPPIPREKKIKEEDDGSYLVGGGCLSNFRTFS